jgi:hypothetical protein
MTINPLFPVIFLLVYIAVILTVLLYHVLKMYEHVKSAEFLLSVVTSTYTPPKKP